MQTAVDTTVGALLDGDPIPARACQSEPIALPTGQQELLISPGGAFVVDGVQLAGPQASQLHTAATVPVDSGAWGADHREVDVPASQASRVLVVPESINPGWTARTADGAGLAPVTVNGWQQGWVIPAGTAPGTVTLAFESNALYRTGLVGGLALLPLLVLLALLPVRRPQPPDEPARPWRPGPVATSLGVLAVGAVISGVAGVVVVGAAMGVRYLLRRRQKLCDAVTVGTAAGGLIVAGAVLVAKPVAIGRRVRRPLGGRSTAGADLGGRAGGVGGRGAGHSEDTRCIADDFGPPCRDGAAGLRRAMKIAHLGDTVAHWCQGKALTVARPRISMPRRLGGSTDITLSTMKATFGLRMTLRHFWVRPNACPTMSIVEPSGPMCTPTGLICGSPAGPMVQNRPIGWLRRYANSAGVNVMVSPFGPGFGKTQRQVRVDS